MVIGRGSICIIVLSLLIGARHALAFDFQDVVNQAQQLSQKPYAAPKKIPSFLQELSFDQYQSIRFKPENSLWRGGPSPFQVMLISPGLYYTHAVKINVVDAQGTHKLDYKKNDFSYSDAEIEKRVPADLGFAGFKLTYPFNDPKVQNQFLVFAGASYFRGVGKDNSFGISARGLAVNTGLSTGEDFPSFIEYWLVRPAAKAKQVEFYGLLDGKNVAGAYHFTVTPGPTTKLQVEVKLFPREEVSLLGAAPLTSMFYYGENTPRPRGEWRPQVHDSDGLLIHNGATGEWLWRPLLNPKHLQMYYFDTENVRGFGLLQRQVDFHDYEDFGARYEKRPSAWIAPTGDWGHGKVVLVELPTANETSDNIVAFWTPGDKVTPAKPLELSYTLGFGTPDLAGETIGSAQSTFVGDGNVIGGGTSEGAYRIIVDFTGPELAKLPPDAPITGEVTAQYGGSVLEHFMEYVAPTRSWRLSILAKPADGKPLALRAFLKNGDETVSETWTYELPVGNQLKVKGD